MKKVYFKIHESPEDPGFSLSVDIEGYTKEEVIQFCHFILLEMLKNYYANQVDENAKIISDLLDSLEIKPPPPPTPPNG